MNSTKFWVFIIIITFLVAIIVVAGVKVHLRHNEKLYHVVHQKIKETALKCYLEGKCEGNITLKDLYDKEYLEIVIDPVTKEEMDQNMCIIYINEVVDFC